MHDRHGAILAHGDLVLVPGRVVGTSNTDDYCNIVVETAEPLYPSKSLSTISLNARQVEKAPTFRAPAALDETTALDVAIGASGVDTSEGDE